MTVLRLEDFLVPESGSLLDAAEAIEHNHSRCAIVVDGDKVVGMISEGDILRALLRGTDVAAPLRDFIRHDIKFLNEPDDAAALRLFRNYGFTLLPVLDEAFRLRAVILLNHLLERVALTA